VNSGQICGAKHTNLLVHELNNRLGIIMGLCDLLLDATPPADARLADLHGIRGESERVVRLLSALVAARP